MSIYRGDTLIAGAADISGKANVALDNLSNAGKIVGAGLGMPDYTTRKTLTLGATETTYTSPANGYYYALVQLSPGGYFQIASSGISQRGQNTSTSSNGYFSVLLPVKKNTTVVVQYDGYVSAAIYNTFVFIYAAGSTSEAN